MSKSYLVIVESPGKIKKLKSILGNDYQVIASMGHVVDLPPKEFGIDLAKMQGRYVTLKSDIAKRLKVEAAKPYDVIYLASDPDREGEAISHHIANLLKKAKTKAQLQRVSFDAITPSAVQTAFNNPRSIDDNLVAAQDARRLLDRLVGFPASRYLWGHVSGMGLSAGRVQSAALRLVVERDTEIQKFVPEEYWTITGLFKAKEGEFSAKLSKWKGKKPALKAKADADAILDALKDEAFKIASVKPKQRQQKPPAPFVTSSLQQAASSHLRMSPDSAMLLAQKLYEVGLITYHRTDSPAVSPEGIQMAKQTILHYFDERYLGNHRYGAKGNAQEAHECIRPTDTDTNPEKIQQALSTNDARAVELYGLIWKRFLASQMANSVYNEVHVNVIGGDALFSAKGSQLAFDGFLRVYNLDEERETTKREDDDDTPNNKQLPTLTLGEPVDVLKLTPKQHFTKPPTPYSEALLIKALEKHGVGRPSTFAQTVKTLKKRKYVKSQKRRLHPTDLGKDVFVVLDSKLTGLFELAFTAEMEAKLDAIAEGKQDSTAYLQKFWDDVSPLFGEDVITKTVSSKSKGKKSRKSSKPHKPRTAKKNTPVKDAVGICPKCGKPLVKRNGKRGEFIGCSGFPKCRHTQNVKQ